MRESIRRRRGVVGLSLVSMGSMALVALYQMGILKRVPEPRLPGVDADKVDGSPQAYSLLEMPDAVLGIGSYAARLTFDETTKYKAFCSWCLLATAASLATVPLVVPEARAAVKHLSRYDLAVVDIDVLPAADSAIRADRLDQFVGRAGARRNRGHS